MASCVICGRDIDPGSSRCPFCGCHQQPVMEAPAELSSAGTFPALAAAPAPAEEAPRRKKSRWWMPVTVAAALLVAGLVYLLLSSPPDPGLSGPEQALEAYRTATAEPLPDHVKALFPSGYLEFRADLQDANTSALLDTVLSKRSQENTYFESLYGTFALEYQILEQREPAGNIQTLLRQALAQQAIDPEQIGQMWDLTVWQKIRGDKDEGNSIQYFTAIQIGQDWYLMTYHQAGNTLSAWFVGYPDGQVNIMWTSNKD